MRECLEFVQNARPKLLTLVAARSASREAIQAAGLSFRYLYTVACRTKADVSEPYTAADPAPWVEALDDLLATELALARPSTISSSLPVGNTDFNNKVESNLINPLQAA